MQHQVDIVKKVRTFILEEIKDLSVEQLNKIPDGFNNNIIWNLGHMVAAQQAICYKRAGLPLQIGDLFFEHYKPGSRPQHTADDAAISQIKELLLITPDLFLQDYDREIFTNYVPWVSRYGVAIDTVEAAFGFVPFHDGLHSGMVTALNKLVRL